MSVSTRLAYLTKTVDWDALQVLSILLAMPLESANKLPKLSMELSRSSDKLDRLSNSLKEIDTALDEIKQCQTRIVDAKGRYQKVIQRENDYKQKKAAKQG